MPLGILLKNENIVEEMIDIMLKMHDYVPIKHHEVVDEKTQCSVAADVFHSVLFGGDQLTHKRAETAKELRKHS